MVKSEVDVASCVAPGQPLRGRRPPVVRHAVDARGRNQDQPRRIRIGRRRQEHALDQPEHGRGTADAQAECQHRDERDGRRSTALTQRIAHVADEVAQPAPQRRARPLLAKLLRHRGDATDLDTGTAVGFFRIEPGGHALRGPLLHV